MAADGFKEAPHYTVIDRDITLNTFLSVMQIIALSVHSKLRWFHLCWSKANQIDVEAPKQMESQVIVCMLSQLIATAVGNRGAKTYMGGVHTTYFSMTNY